MTDPRAQQENIATVMSRKQEILIALMADIGGALELPASEVATDVPFLEMGADSIVMVEAIAIIEQRYGVKLALRQFFEELSTLEAVASHLDANIPTAPVVPPPPAAAPPAVLPPAFVAPTVGPLALTPNADGSPLLHRVLMEQQHLMAQFLANQAELLRAMNGQPSAPMAPVLLAPALVTVAAPAPVVAAVASASLVIPEAPAVDAIAKPMMPWGGSSETRKRGTSAQQQAHLDALIARYTARTPKSKAEAQQYRRVLADSRATVGFRLSTKEILYPISGARSEGSRLWDIDGNEYIDYTMGFGVHLLGHRPAVVQPAIEAALHQAVEIGMRSDVVGEVATLLSETTGLDRFAFTNSGTEAVMAAVRLARAKTGRDKIVMFSNAYHGHADITLARSAHETGRITGVPLVGGVPMRQAEDVIVLEYGDEAALDIIRRHGHEIAAVLIEPVQSRNLRLQPRAFLQSLRTLTRETGSALIFDEMITGFRAHLGGAQAHFGVTADLATYGKIIGGGLPIGAVGGMSDWMDGIDGGFWQYGDSSYPPAERTAFGGTFCQHPMSMVAARAVLRHLKAQGPALQETLNARTGRLVETLNSFFRDEEVPITATNFSSLFRFEFSSNLDLLFYHMLEKGIYIWEWRSCFLSTAHTDEDVARFTTAVQETVDEMRRGGFVPPPTRTAVRTAPVTQAQRQLVTATKIDADANLAYQVRTAIAIEGPLNGTAMAQAVQSVTDRHSALRTSLPDAESDRQRIRLSVRMPLPLVDLTETPAARDAAITAWREAESRQPMSLVHGPLFRAHLLRTSPTSHVLALSAHHVIADGFTMGVLLRDLAGAYNAAVAGNTGATDAPVMQFEEYVALAAAVRDTPDMQAHRAFWSDKFSTGVPELLLPTDRPRPALRSYTGAVCRTSLEGPLVATLRQFARKRGCSLHMTLTAVFTLLLHRVAEQDDLVLGLPVLGRPFPGSMSLVGYCTHLMPLRSQRGVEASFAEHLVNTKRAILEATDHQDLPFAELLDVIGVRPAPDAPPVASVVFNVEPVSALPSFTALAATLLPDVVTTTPFDVFVNVIDAGDRLLIDAQYNTDLFDAETVDCLLAAFTTLVASAVERPDERADALTVLSPPDAELLARVNDTTVTYPHDTLTALMQHGLGHHASDRTARARPALMIHEADGAWSTWTAAQLEASTNQLAQQLRDQYGVGRGTFVGVCAQRGAPMVVALVAVIKAGGAYVPLDPTLPPARLAYQLADCGTGLVLTSAGDPTVDAALSAAFALLPAGVTPPHRVPVANAPASTGTRAARCPDAGVLGDDPAYLIYTSGSTGQPKGAVNTHAGIANRLQWMQSQYPLTRADRVLQKTPYGFDVSVWEFFWPLMTGATLVMARPDGHADAAYLVQCVHDAAITTMHFVPSMLAIWLGEAGVAALPTGQGGALRQVMVSGEALPASSVLRWMRTLPSVTLNNLYGPTEAAIDVSHWTAPVDFQGGYVPIGVPVANTTLQVLDRHGKPCPVGVPGELWIGGVQVGAGYHGRPDLTAQRFLPDAERPGQRRYRTGDRARWRRDGQIEFLGRLDHQIKLRGHRIELGEIESVLLMQGGVTEAVVTLQELVPGHPQLVAYVCLTDERAGEANVPAQLRQALQVHLASAMVPSHIAVLPVLPRLSSGKLDRRALPAVVLSVDAGDDGNSPANNTETEIAAVWCELLQRSTVGRHENFFHLGGDSLLAMQVLARLNATMPRGLTIRDLFQHPTVAGLASCALLTSAAGLPPLAPAVPSAADPLSAEQRPWWMREQLGLAAAAPTPTVFRIDGPLQIDVLHRAIASLVARHEILRTVFREVNGRSSQVVLDASAIVLPLPLTNAVADDPSTLSSIMAQMMAEPMRLDQGPLMRLHVVRHSADTHLLCCSMHHIITDGWSFGVLAAELAYAYAAFSGGTDPQWTPLPVQYRDVVHWQRAVLATPAATAMADYWHTQLADVPRLHLPTDHPRTGAGFRRAQQSLTLSSAVVAQLDATAIRTHATRFIVLQAALKAWLHRTTGQDDICIGTPVSTRVLPALESQIGPYINVLALRDRVASADTFESLVSRVRETTLEGFVRLLIPFEDVVERRRTVREPGRQPVFDVGLTLQNQLELQPRPLRGGLTLLPYDTDGLPAATDAEAMTDLWFIIRPDDEQLVVDLVYNAALFTAASAERFLLNWQRVLLSALADPSLAVGTIPLLRRTLRAAPRAVSIAISTS